MRHFYIDENLSPTIAPPLLNLYRRHRFTTSQRAGLLGWDDPDLFPELSSRQIDVIVTLDVGQLENNEERGSLRSAGLHWIGVPTLPDAGSRLIAQQLAVIAPAVADVTQNWLGVPTAYWLRAPAPAVIGEVTPI